MLVLWVWVLQVWVRGVEGRRRCRIGFNPLDSCATLDPFSPPNRPNHLAHPAPPLRQIHFFPLIFNGKQVYDLMVERCGPSVGSGPKAR